MGNQYPRFLRPRHGTDSISVLQIWTEGSREVQVRAGIIRKQRTFDIWGKGIALVTHRLALHIGKHLSSFHQSHLENRFPKVCLH
jgi:hypothetical protein